MGLEAQGYLVRREPMTAVFLGGFESRVGEGEESGLGWAGLVLGESDIRGICGGVGVLQGVLDDGDGLWIVWVGGYRMGGRWMCGCVDVWVHGYICTCGLDRWYLLLSLCISLLFVSCGCSFGNTMSRVMLN